MLHLSSMFYFLTHPLRHLGCLYFLTAVSNVAVNIGVQSCHDARAQSSVLLCKSRSHSYVSLGLGTDYLGRIIAEMSAR